MKNAMNSALALSSWAAFPDMRNDHARLARTLEIA